MPALLLALLFGVQPSVSPSIEADAEMLLRSRDFSAAQYGMALEDVRRADGALALRTTGAEFRFEPRADRLTLGQRIGKERQVATVRFPEGVLAGLRVVWRADGAAFLTARDGKLEIRINGDSLLMLRDAEGLALETTLGFQPLTARLSRGNALLLDEYGGIGAYVATGEGEGTSPGEGGSLTTHLGAGEILWLSVAPPRPYPWEQSLSDRVCWHWSMETGYPTDEQIAEWSRSGNILLQQAEVMLWKDWSLRFVPRLGPEEFARVNATCERHGMRNIVYTSPLYFLTGTGLEDKAMNSFEHFAETGFSPGDGRGLNWPIFLDEIRKVMDDLHPDGLYFDGIYENVVRTYIVTRKAREIVGDEGLLEYHATGSPPGGGVYLPQIDTYFDFILRGEGVEASYTDSDYLRYFVSTYNISNSIGVLCNNNNHPLDEAFVNGLLDLNIRLHWLLGGSDDQRTQGMERFYWPALNESLHPRVEAATREREASSPRVWKALRQARDEDTSQLAILYQTTFADGDFRAQGQPGQATEQALPEGWSAWLSPRSGGEVATGDEGLRISALGNTVVALEREVPPETTAVECRVRGSGECGQSWGPALALRVGGRVIRLGIRSDGKAQVDRSGAQTLFEGFPPGEWFWLRIRLSAGCVVCETSTDGREWRLLHVEWVGDLGRPESFLIGKVPYDGSRTEYAEPGAAGGCEISEVRVLGAAR